MPRCLRTLIRRVHHGAGLPLEWNARRLSRPRKRKLRHGLTGLTAWKPAVPSISLLTRQLAHLIAAKCQTIAILARRLNLGTALSLRIASLLAVRRRQFVSAGEPLTYRKEVRLDSSGVPAEPEFISDLFKAQILGDFSASERLSRHGEEMMVEHPNLVKRAVSTGGVPGFLPPAYLSELFAAYARAGRPTANLCRKLPLPPEGMTVNIPRITTATATGIQASENATVANADPAATLLTANVNTVAGYVTVSRQAIERGPLTSEVIASDLAADYNSKLDAQVLNGSGSSGQHLGILNVAGINAVTYTAATPVLVGATTPMWPKLASCIGQVMSGRFAGPSAIVMSATEWAWMLSTCDASTYRPIIQPNQQGGAYNPAGTLDGGSAGL